MPTSNSNNNIINSQYFHAVETTFFYNTIVYTYILYNFAFYFGVLILHV